MLINLNREIAGGLLGCGRAARITYAGFGAVLADNPAVTFAYSAANAAGPDPFECVVVDA